MKYYQVLRIILILIPIVALGSFGYRYINPSGDLVVSYGFCETETPYFSGLSPHGRVLGLDTKKCNQSMVIDPVYFDVRLAQSYRSVEIELEYDKQEFQGFSVGVGIDPDNWNWKFGTKNSPPRRALSETGEQRAVNSEQELITIDLSQAQFENNRYRFIISAPGLDISGEDIEFYNMELRFSKEALTQDNLWQRIRSII